MLSLRMWLEVCSRNAIASKPTAFWMWSSSEIFLLRTGYFDSSAWGTNSTDARPGQIWRSSSKCTALVYIVIPPRNTCSTWGSQLHLALISPRAHPHCCLFLIRAELHPTPLYCQVGGSLLFCNCCGKTNAVPRSEGATHGCAFVLQAIESSSSTARARLRAEQVSACSLISFFLPPFSWKLNCQD